VPALGLPDPLARLYGTALRLGITVLNGASEVGPWPDESTAAILAT